MARPPFIITPKMFKDRDEYLVLISNITGIPADDILGRGRLHNVVIARQLLIWALSFLCRYTTSEVGTLVNRHHSTVTYAVGIVSHERVFPRDELRHFKNLILRHHRLRKEASNERISTINH